MYHKCKNHPNRFFYTCGNVVLPDRETKITDFVKTCHAYFGVKLGDQDKPFAPQICCKTCVENLRDWLNKKRKSMLFGVPKGGRKGKDHVTDCCFCMTNLKGINRKNKYHIQYLDVPSVIKSVSHGTDLIVPEPDFTMEFSSDPEYSDTADTAQFCVCNLEEGNRPVPLAPHRTQRSHTKKEPFQGVYSAIRLTPSRETSAATRGYILFVSGMRGKIEKILNV